MDFKKLADEAKAAIDKRGGTDSLKEDLGELKDIASGEGSLADKAKEAVEAVKDPGDDGTVTPDPAPAQPGEAAPDSSPQEGGGRHRGQGGGHGGGGHGGQGKHRGGGGRQAR